MFLVVARVHVKLDGPLEKVKPAEDEIVTTIASVLNGTSIADSIRIWQRVHLKLIAARKGQSIVLYIWCETKEDLLRVHDSLTSCRLKDPVEQFFNQLLTQSRKVAVNTITVNDEEFRRMKAYFTGNQLFNISFELFL